MDECIFCKIASGKIGAEKIYEDEKVLAFLDIRPRSPGHTLVIPKKHFEVISDMDDELVAEVFKTVKKVMKMLKKSLKPDAFTVGVNDGRASGQEIPHVHVNIFPRFEGDGGGPVHMVVSNPLREDISKTAEKIRKSS